MNDIYLYDGSFMHLLAGIDELLIWGKNPIKIQREQDYQTNLLENPIYFPKKEIDDFITNILEKSSPFIFQICYHVFLSNNEQKEIIIFYFLKNALKYGNSIIYRRNLKCVVKALKIQKYVTGEAHRLKGFLRFQEINNSFLYAKMAPENNIIELLSKHFASRLKNEKWIIHDTKRHICSIYQNGNYYFSNELDIIKQNWNIENSEINYEKLWKTFFKTIAITQRANKKCQQNFMPKKYWKYILEMSEEYENNH